MCHNTCEASGGKITGFRLTRIDSSSEDYVGGNNKKNVLITELTAILTANLINHIEQQKTLPTSIWAQDLSPGRMDLSQEGWM